MQSRYNFMQESKVCDEDGLPYPDVLTTNYSDVAITTPPKIHNVSVSDITKMWMLMYNTYEVPSYDDILLNLNGIGYVGELEPGSKIVMFSLNDLQRFNTNKRKEVE